MQGNDNSFASASSVAAGVQGYAATATKTTTATASPEAFNQSFREALNEANRTKLQWAATELQNSRIRMQEIKLKFAASMQKKDEEENSYEIQQKCMDIARRIMKGEKVSQAELRMLMQFDPKLYFMAMLFKQDELKLKKDEEEEEDQTAEDGTVESAATAESSGAAAETSEPAPAAECSNATTDM